MNKQHDGDVALARKVYRLAEENMKKAGGRMPCSEQMFLILRDAAPDTVEYSAISALENIEFAETVFLLLLRRPIDDAARNAWKARADLPPVEFQRELLRSVLRSEEYRRSAVPLLGCPFSFEGEMPKAPVLVEPEGMQEKLKRIYRKLPGPMQSAARKLLKRGDA